MRDECVLDLLAGNSDRVKCVKCRERERVMSKENPDDVMAVRGLCKRYTKKGRLAVDR